MQRRRRLRALALQALYEIDFTAHPADDVQARYVEENGLEPDAEEFFRYLVGGVVADTHSLDDLIHAHAPEWPVDQLAVVDRNILRMAIHELMTSQETSIKIAINEAVELAKIYASDSAPRFINGVLGTIVVNLEAQIAANHRSRGGSTPSL